MAFDVTNTNDLAALRDEQLNDPVGMGYAAVDGDVNKTLDLFNNEANNVGVEVGNAKLLAGDLLSIIFGISVSSQDQFKIQLVFESSSGTESDVSAYRPDLIALSNALADEINLHTRHLNRAEALFSNVDANGVIETVVISRSDWFAARDHVGT